MILRALILLGWTDPVVPGPNPVECLYCGIDGAALEKAHQEAQKLEKYIAFRRLVNPGGNPMPVVVDPTPKPPVFFSNKIEDHEPDLAKKLEAAEERVMAEKQAAADKAKAVQFFANLAAKSKAELMDAVEAFNSTADNEKKITFATPPNKPDIINALAKAAGYLQ